MEYLGVINLPKISSNTNTIYSLDSDFSNTQPKFNNKGASLYARPIFTSYATNQRPIQNPADYSIAYPNNRKVGSKYTKRQAYTTPQNINASLYESIAKEEELPDYLQRAPKSFKKPPPLPPRRQNHRSPLHLGLNDQSNFVSISKSNAKGATNQTKRKNGILKRIQKAILTRKKTQNKKPTVYKTKPAAEMERLA